jgi:mRNA interferase MazF
VTESPDPRRGEIWLTSFGAGRRGEPGKNRPALIVSTDEILAGEEHELIVVVPLSSSSAPSALRPEVGPETGIDNPSAAVCRGVRGLSRQRLLRRLGEAPPERMAEVERALGLVLGFG